MADEYPVLQELETKLKLQWVDVNDAMATQRAIIQVEPESAYLELPRGRKGDKGDPGPAISIQGIVAADSQLPANPEVGHAYVNTSTKGLAVWNGSSWFKVNDFAGVDADVQQFSRWFAQIESDTRRALTAADRAEYAAEETIQQVTGDFATRNYVDTRTWDRGVVGADVTSIDQLEIGSWGVASTTVATNLGLPGTLGNLTVSRVANGKSVLYRTLESGTQKHSMWMTSITGGVIAEWSKIFPINTDSVFHGVIPNDTASIADLAVGEWGSASTSTANSLGLPFTLGTLKILPIANGKTVIGIAQESGTQKHSMWMTSISNNVVAPWKRIDNDGDAGGAPGLKTAGVTLTAGSSLDGSAGRCRVLAQVTAPVTRWRVHIESRRQVFSSTADFRLGDVFVGDHSGNGVLTNQLKIKTGFTDVSGSSEWVSAWVTKDISKEILVDFNVTGTGLYSYQAGAYRLNGSTWQAAKEVPVAVWIEVETYAETPVVAMIGDSTGAGQGADRPVFDSALHVAGRKHGFIPMNYSYPGSTMQSMTNPDHHIYKRWAGLSKPDSVIVQAGSNDIHGGTSTSDLRNRFEKLADLARGISPVLFGATVKARYPNSGDFAPALTEHNEYVKSQPAGTRGYLDFYAAVSPAGTVLPADSADTAHLSTSGHAKLAAAFDGVTVSRPQAVDAASALKMKADKAYVDNATSTVGYTTGVHAGKYVKLNDAGKLFISTQSITGAGDPVNKAYVDDRVSLAASSQESSRLSAEEAKQSALTAGNWAQKTQSDSDKTGSDRDYVSQQVAAIDTALAESVPPYLQPDSPTGLGASYQTAVVARADANREVSWQELQDAADRAFSQGRKLYAEGLVKTDKTLSLRCSGDLSGLTIKYSGSGECIRVGSLDDSTATSRLSLSLPKIECVNKPSQGWVEGTVGVNIVRAYGCNITIPFILNFETGLRLYSNKGACAYNNITPIDIWGWKVGIELISDWIPNRGWTNENKFFGGRISQGGTGALANIRMTGSLDENDNVEGRPNNNSFFGVCLEGSAAQYTVLLEDGSFNGFYHCRWEYSNGVSLGKGSHENLFVGGYGLNTVPKMEDSAAVRNLFEGSAYRYSMQKQSMRKPGSTHETFVIDPANSAMLLGTGSGDPQVRLSLSGSNSLAFKGANFIPSTSYSAAEGGSDCGSETRKWRDVSAGRYLRLGNLVIRENEGTLQVATSTSGPWKTVGMS